MSQTNCKNCGGPLDIWAPKCEYCGTLGGCKFCADKHIECRGLGETLEYAKKFFDNIEYRKYCHDGIMLKSKNELCFDNSQGEYAEMGIDINYCPFCGRQLVDELTYEQWFEGETDG